MKYSNSNFGLDGRGAKLAYFILNKVQAAKIMKGSITNFLLIFKMIKSSKCLIKYHRDVIL